MKGKLPSIVMVFVALALVFSLVAVVASTTGINANPGRPLEWREITIPQDGEDGGYALWNASDVGPIAVSPDGGTIFAAVYNGTVWFLMRSTDDGYSWRNPITKIDGVVNTTFANATDTSAIVAIVIPSDWEDSEAVVVATENNTYYSSDRGVTFTKMAVPGGAGTGNVTITSLDVTLDEDGNHIFLVGTKDADAGWGGVYLKTLVGTWIDQSVGNYEVLAVAFSPNYATEGGTAGGQIVAVVSDASSTHVRAKFGESVWANTITDAVIKDQNDADFVSTAACIGFPGDYTATDPSLFIGITAGNVTVPVGDAYRVDWDTAWEATDLNVRGTVGVNPTETNIVSIAVSGNASAATIMVGTETVTPAAVSTDRQLLVYVSSDSGATWDESAKQPTGTANATVVIGSAYVGTQGTESAFSASTDDGVSWNQRGLIDTVINTINDTAPSPTYATDSTLFMVTNKSATGNTSLWQTTDEGATWERVFTSTLTDDKGKPACDFTIVRLCPDFPTEAGIFVAVDQVIYRSSDGGVTFPDRITTRTGESITAMEVVSLDTFYTGADDGKVWRTTNGGTTWAEPVDSDIPATATVTDIVVQDNAILVGTSEGKVYICYDVSDAFEFEQVGPVAAIGGSGSITQVAFDADYADNDTVYASRATTSNVYRFVIGTSTTWDSITTETIGNVEANELVVTDDGTLYASDDTAFNATTNVGGIARSVDPTKPMDEDSGPSFEWMARGLSSVAPNASLTLLRVVPGSNILFAVNSSAQLITFEDTLTGKPTLSLPADESTAGITLESGDWYGYARVTLVWELMTGALNHSYQVAYDADFDSLAVNGTSTGSTVDVYLNPGITYYWRVRVTDRLLSQWSETWSFTTPLGPAVARPTLLSPAAGATGVALTPVLQWTSVSGATIYELQVARNCSWTDLVVDETLGNVQTYLVPSGVLAYDTNYCWKVGARSETTEAAWSDEGSFTTLEEAVPVEAEPTEAWVWVVIAIGAILVIALIVLIVRAKRLP